MGIFWELTKYNSRFPRLLFSRKGRKGETNRKSYNRVLAFFTQRAQRMPNSIRPYVSSQSNRYTDSSFRIPHSSFRINHSAFIIPNSAFIFPHSAFSELIIPNSAFIFPISSFRINHSAFIIPNSAFIRRIP